MCRDTGNTEHEREGGLTNLTSAATAKHHPARKKKDTHRTLRKLKRRDRQCLTCRVGLSDVRRLAWSGKGKVNRPGGEDLRRDRECWKQIHQADHGDCQRPVVRQRR